MERTIAQKLQALLKLQAIDSKIDEIKKIRGDLPNEVQDLEDEIAGIQTRINNFLNDIKKLESDIEEKRQIRKDSEKLIAKYKEQQNNVRNNREFEALSKEIEAEELEIQLCEKRIREANEKIAKKRIDIEETTKKLNERKKDLENKRAELETIMAESEEEENRLLKEREKQVKNIEERLLYSYERLRKNSSNGLAVVTVKRDACSGCFNIVPPQRQAEIRENRKIIVCEHCGRILASVEEKENSTTAEKSTRRIGIKDNIFSITKE
ncbi:MAG: C4-type zinc ribbon domain-containing protein [Microscillaceae bacterium]|nr:C4-type zinc ribbon domain-containing protein [Microscillaceae bacterium]MDW8460926.1 C4-type zinc ribbon domain-containing protein [Cytophagales bacterium]